MKLVDFKLGVKDPVWAVAHLMDGMAMDPEPGENWRAETSTWYNGRERGLVFSIGGLMGPVLHVAVFEHRNSDNIVALRWEESHWPMNPPTIADSGEKAYHGGSKWDTAHSVPYNGAYEMAAWVVGQFQTFVQGNQK